MIKLYRENGLYCECASCHRLKTTDNTFVTAFSIPSYEFLKFIQNTKDDPKISQGLCLECYDEQMAALRKEMEQCSESA